MDYLTVSNTPSEQKASSAEGNATESGSCDDKNGAGGSRSVKYL